MKRCPYCGKRYPDREEVCPEDQHHLEQLTDSPQRPAPGRTTDSPTFNARVFGRGISSGQYRVFLRGDDFVFIRVGSEEKNKALMTELAGFLGPFGGFLSIALKLWSRKKSEKKLSETELNPDDLRRENEKDFTLYLPEIREAVARPPSQLALWSEQAGRLELSLRDGRTVKLQLPTSEDLKVAQDCLILRLNCPLRKAA